MKGQTCVRFQHYPYSKQSVFALVSKDFVAVLDSTHRWLAKHYAPCNQQLVDVRRQPLQLSLNVRGFALRQLSHHLAFQQFLPEETKSSFADETKPQMSVGQRQPDPIELIISVGDQRRFGQMLYSGVVEKLFQTLRCHLFDLLQPRLYL